MVATLPLRDMFEDGRLRISFADSVLYRLYPWLEAWTLFLEAITFYFGALVDLWTPEDL